MRPPTGQPRRSLWSRGVVPRRRRGGAGLKPGSKCAGTVDEAWVGCHVVVGPLVLAQVLLHFHDIINLLWREVYLQHPDRLGSNVFCRETPIICSTTMTNTQSTITHCYLFPRECIYILYRYIHVQHIFTCTCMYTYV